MQLLPEDETCPNPPGQEMVLLFLLKSPDPELASYSLLINFPSETITLLLETKSIHSWPLQFHLLANLLRGVRHVPAFSDSP